MSRDTQDGCLIFALVGLVLTALAIYVVVMNR